MSWAWFHQWGSPRFFYRRADAMLPWCAWLSLVLLAGTSFWVLAVGPEDFRQGNSFRIFYIHVPAAILAQGAFFAMAVAAVVGLVWRLKLAFLFIQVAAPVGASITLLALVTGAVWGKPTWGTWWEWDARLTSTLLQFFIYLAIVAIYEAIEDRDSAARVAAIATLVGVVNLPIIKFSVNWWNTLHQPATFTFTSAPAMPASMWVPGLVMLIGFLTFFTLVVLLRMQNAILERERRAEWVREMLEAKGVL